MIIVIRGHIRKSFETTELYDLIENLYNIFPNLKIYIHTWNVYSSNISWRKVQANNIIVTEEIINNYFGKFNTCIKHIIIDDDTNIELIGEVSKRKICKTQMPIIGWKNYLYGKYKRTRIRTELSKHFLW